MKTSSELRSEIEAFGRFAVDADIALYSNPVVEVAGASGTRRVTWDAGRHSDGSLFRRSFLEVEDYRVLLESNAFSFLLFDGAIIQASVDFLHSDVCGSRFAYIPCPFDLDSNLIGSDPLLDVVDVYSAQEARVVRLRSALRFDYDPSAQRDDHPAAHMSLLSSDCRWAVVAPLSFGHFIRFVFRHFYSSLWRAHPEIRAWPQWLGARTITTEDETQLHIGCARV